MRTLVNRKPQQFRRGGFAVTAALIVGTLAGCANQSTSTTSAAAQPASAMNAPQSSTTASSARATTPARPKRKPTSHGPVVFGALVDSTASDDVVQSQPAPRSCHARGTGLFSEPDPACTPGALNSAVTQATIGQTICVSGWTETVRPSESVTEREKSASMDAYGDTGSMSGYEYDHLVSLELGGATNDARNLWPEPGASPNPKDSVENALHREVCDGQLTLAEAQHIIATEWVKWARSHGITQTTGWSSSGGGSNGANSSGGGSGGSSAPTSPAAIAPTPSSQTVVHSGAYCAPAGATGVTDEGTPMTCKPSATDTHDRWRRS